MDRRRRHETLQVIAILGAWFLLQCARAAMADTEVPGATASPDGAAALGDSLAPGDVDSSGLKAPRPLSRHFPGLRLIPSGRFRMGSPEWELFRYGDEWQHDVAITKPFYLLDHEVTQEEWQAVMKWNESYFVGARRPVEQITWYDAIAFCNRCSIREGLTPAYTIEEPKADGAHLVAGRVLWNRDASGYRLPTESEWEYACRGGTRTAFFIGRIVHCCRQFDPGVSAIAWYAGNAAEGTHEVKKKSANAWGLYDTHGNVWEWCWDWYGEYPIDAVRDPLGSANGVLRVTRGGGWISYARLCRSAYRGSVNPPQRENYIGLRIARNF